MECPPNYISYTPTFSFFVLNWFLLFTQPRSASALDINVRNAVPRTWVACSEPRGSFNRPNLHCILTVVSTTPLALLSRKSTGIVGLARNTNPLPGLTATYNATLEVLGGMPADAAYRKNVEILTNDRLSTVTSVREYATSTQVVFRASWNKKDVSVHRWTEL